MRKKLLFRMIILLTLVLLFIAAPIVQAATYTVGGKTITFEKFKIEGIDEEIVYAWDYTDNLDGMLFFTETDKIYHMNLDGTVEEITEEEADKLYDEGKLVEDYWIYCGYESEEPKEFSQDLPELTFVEGTEEKAGLYAVKIGEEIVSDYIYTTVRLSNEEENGMSFGNVILGVCEKNDDDVDVWVNTKTDSPLFSANTEEDFPSFSDDLAFIMLYVLNEQGNFDLNIFDWSGNKILTLEVTDEMDIYVKKINTYNHRFVQVDIENNGVTKTEVYDLDGKKVLESENDVWLYAFQFGMIEYHSYEENTSKVIEIKNNTTISNAVETDWVDLYATTAKLKKTSEDYLAPGKYYFITAEDMVYEMTISYSILNGANASFDKTSAKDLTIKADGDLEKLKGIYVDNEKLEEDNYTLTSGSTIVTLKNEYLKTLEAGEHTLKIQYLDGEVETKFTITETIEKGEKDEEPKMGIDQTQNIVAYVGVIAIVGLAFVVSKRVK